MRNRFLRFRALRAPVPVAAAVASLVIGMAGLILTHPSPSSFSEFTAYVIASDASAGSPAPELSAILDAQLVEPAAEAAGPVEETPVALEPVESFPVPLPRVVVAAAAGQPTSVQPIGAPEASEPGVPEPAPAGPTAGPVAAAASAGGGPGVASPTQAPALPGVTITMTGSSKAKPSGPPPPTPITVNSTKQAPNQSAGGPDRMPAAKPTQKPASSKK